MNIQKNTTNDVKNHFVTARFGEVEYVELMNRARMHSVSASTMLRGALGFSAVPPARTDAKTAIELGKIGAALWQILLEGHEVDNPQVETAIEETRATILALRVSLLGGKMEGAKRS